jgi:hypothetical protein
MSANDNSYDSGRPEISAPCFQLLIRNTLTAFSPSMAAKGPEGEQGCPRIAQTM